MKSEKERADLYWRARQFVRDNGGHPFPKPCRMMADFARSYAAEETRKVLDEAADWVLATPNFYEKSSLTIANEIRNLKENKMKKEQDKIHKSDCSLHNGPAFEPKPCDCGVQPGITPEEYGSEFPSKE